MKAQVLDSMDIERERGITIKAQNLIGPAYRFTISFFFNKNMVD